MHGPETPLVLGCRPAAPRGAAVCEQGNESDAPGMLISAVPAGQGEGFTSFMSEKQLQHFRATLPTEQTNSSYLINSVSKGEYCYLRSSVNLKYSLIS